MRKLNNHQYGYVIWYTQTPVEYLKLEPRDTVVNLTTTLYRYMRGAPFHSSTPRIKRLFDFIFYSYISLLLFNAYLKIVCHSSSYKYMTKSNAPRPREGRSTHYPLKLLPLTDTKA